ncbi:MAG: AAA family ATPase [Nitrososphaerota archaeon]
MSRRHKKLVYTDEDLENNCSDNRKRKNEDGDKTEGKSRKSRRLGGQNKVLEEEKFFDIEYFDQEEYDEILEEFSDQSWFRELGEDERDYYVRRMMKLRSCGKKIPTVKDILDLKICPEDARSLLLERMELDEYDKLSSDYDAACQKFLKRFSYISENGTGRDLIKKVEKNIIEQAKYIQPLRDRILMSKFDDKIKSIIYDKYLTMCSSGENDIGKYQSWIETVLSIPHEQKMVEFDQKLSREIAFSKLIREMMDKLNQNIYGMEVAKEELLCMVAGMISNPGQNKYKAIGLAGPPGIGKTLMVRVLANVLKFPLEIIALGGITNASFLEGHAFTYVGSEPGCIVKALIRMKYTNGIIFFDEIDKISKTEHGKEIEHSLLHIIDFTQNHDFRDKYMPEIPINLSNIIFIFSMNSVDGMDTTLLNRIPIIHFDGYTEKQKVEIVEKYIIPELLDDKGIGRGEILFSREVVEHLVSVIREDVVLSGQKTGVRHLKNTLNRIINRINLYRLMSAGGKEEVKLSFKVPNFKIPYNVTIDLVDSIISSLGDQKKSVYSSMYV